MRIMLSLISLVFMAHPAIADERTVYLADEEGQRIEVARLDLAADGTYAVEMNDTAFTDHFLSMRPFKCLEGPKKTWCHVPYPYEIRRNISSDLTDLEYDFLFLWKPKNDYGIDMWNGIYYRLTEDGETLQGELHEMDMDLLSVPPDAGNFRPLRDQDIIESDPDSHWLPKLIVE